MTSIEDPGTGIQPWKGGTARGIWVHGVNLMVTWTWHCWSIGLTVWSPGSYLPGVQLYVGPFALCARWEGDDYIPF